MGRFGAVWGLTGLTVLLAYAIFRLTRIAIDAFSFDFQWYHWLILIANLVFMAYAEGYRGFQKAFSPRVAARAKHLWANPRLMHVALAPLFCMGYFHTTRRRLISAYVLTALIIIFVFLAHQLSQPWRGILDVGVVTGLIWGLFTVFAFSAQALTKQEFKHSPELPHGSQNAPKRTEENKEKERA